MNSKKRSRASTASRKVAAAIELALARGEPIEDVMFDSIGEVVEAFGITKTHETVVAYVRGEQDRLADLAVYKKQLAELVRKTSGRHTDIAGLKKLIADLTRRSDGRSTTTKGDHP
jgi:hypothetical protein